jgi:hypothetical protein
MKLQVLANNQVDFTFAQVGSSFSCQRARGSFAVGCERWNEVDESARKGSLGKGSLGKGSLGNVVSSVVFI